MSTRRFVDSTITFVVLMAVIAIGFAKTQAIEDWWKLRDYTPSVNVAALARQDTMTAAARHLFYVNHPALLSSTTTFRQDCPENEQTIVLGCYRPGEGGIFIYSVTDPRLIGVQQVTAAHEMLHAEYERLSSADRNNVDRMLNDFYTNDIHDQRIIDTINAYKKTEPNDVVNEMHSVFGTEIGNLPAPLEAYYGRYFTNRAAIVGFANQYQGEFTTREAQLNADDAQLVGLKTQIDSEEATLGAELAQINADRARLDAERNSGQIDQYNAGVDSYNSEVETYDSGIKNQQSDIADYNGLVNERNAIAGELASLEKSLDTRQTPQTVSQ